jgi:hypothetical protein
MDGFWFPFQAVLVGFNFKHVTSPVTSSAEDDVFGFLYGWSTLVWFKFTTAFASMSSIWVIVGSTSGHTINFGVILTPRADFINLDTLSFFFISFNIDVADREISVGIFVESEITSGWGITGFKDRMTINFVVNPVNSFSFSNSDFEFVGFI